MRQLAVASPLIDKTAVGKTHQLQPGAFSQAGHMMGKKFPRTEHPDHFPKNCRGIILVAQYVEQTTSPKWPAANGNASPDARTKSGAIADAGKKSEQSFNPFPQNAR